MADAFSGLRVLVTGGTGFIGGYLVSALVERGAIVTVLSRRTTSDEGKGYHHVMGDLARPESLEGICRDVDLVFHLGGHAHALDELDDVSDELNRKITVEGTQALLEQSLTAGVNRFLFFSSVKAMGEGGEDCQDESAECRPTSSYGRAKLSAERLVQEASRQGLEVTILRLPMVYGPGCKGNLPRMIQSIEKRRFPPLPETGNRRSMVDVRDVVQAALLAIMYPDTGVKTYILTDGQTYSTRQLYEWIHAALHRSIPTWVVPVSLLRIAAYLGDLIGAILRRRFAFDSDALDKLIGSACYLSEKINHELNFHPAYTLDKVLPEIVSEAGNT